MPFMLVFEQGELWPPFRCVSRCGPGLERHGADMFEWLMSSRLVILWGFQNWLAILRSIEFVFPFVVIPLS